MEVKSTLQMNKNVVNNGQYTLLKTVIDIEFPLNFLLFYFEFFH